MRILQINVTANFLSTGKIAEDIGIAIKNNGWESWIAYSRGGSTSQSHLLKIGNIFDSYEHAIETRLFDNHGLASRLSTKQFINTLRHISPDVIHLHNIHGYYLNYKLLFDYIKEADIPVVWTLHDCWPFTGHCAYFDMCDCELWKETCHHCPNKSSFPSSKWFDASRRNHEIKKQAFADVKRMFFVPVSDWLRDLIGKSFLGSYPCQTIHNGIDTDLFKPSGNTQQVLHKYDLCDEKIILGVANGFGKRKGLADFVKLSKKLDSRKYRIVLVGLKPEEMQGLPSEIIALSRTNNVQDLIELYSNSVAFLNPTYEDNFPTTNIEALACGTPVITYNTGGSPEAVNKDTGLVLPQGDIGGLVEAVEYMSREVLSTKIRILCRKRAVEEFNRTAQFNKYIDIYNKVISNN